MIVSECVLFGGQVSLEFQSEPQELQNESIASRRAAREEDRDLREAAATWRAEIGVETEEAEWDDVAVVMSGATVCVAVVGTRRW